MIITELQNTIPYSIASGMATKIQADPIVEPTEQSVNTFCYCKFECEYVEKVFGDLTSNDYWKNDKNTFMYRKQIAADTVTIKLFKNNVEIATITDNTYGDYENGITGVNPEQLLYVKFTIDWQSVLTLEGGGEYQICTELNILGNTFNKDSQKFRLYQYSDYNANGTVRIETYQDGNIIGSDFDFTGLNLYNSYRFAGRFFEGAPKLESDRYLTTGYELKQIQDSSIPQYTLKTQKIPRIIINMLTRDSILANEFLVTDYNIKNDDVFRRISVYPEGIDKQDIGKNTRAIFEIPFTDKFELIRKRNN